MHVPWDASPSSASHEPSLLAAALWVAKDEYPGLSPAEYEGRLDRYAAGLREPFARAEHDGARLVLLNRFLYTELGFAGDDGDYFDPRNNYVNDVLDRRLGNPISLAVVQLALAQRLGLPLRGVSFPGHFLVSLPLDDGLIVLDPYHQGRTLDLPELRRRARQELAARTVDDQRLAKLLEPADQQAIVIRLLRNLKASYERGECWDKALRCADRLVTLCPQSLGDLRERGDLYLRLGHHAAARSDLRRYLALAPNAADREDVSSRLNAASRDTQRLH